MKLEDNYRVNFVVPLDERYLFIYLFIISVFTSSLFKVEIYLTYKKDNKSQQQDSLYIKQQYSLYICIC